MNNKIYKTKEFYLVNNSLTNKELASLAGCSESTINRAKRELELTFQMLKDPKWDYKKLLEITPISMYWAGFLLADGCFSQEARKVKLSIASSIIDQEHILKFKTWLNSDNIIYYTNDNCCSFSVYSKKHLPDIMKFWNFSYRKTYVPYEIPEHIFNNENFKYFIVGLIDGDGSVVTTGNTYKISITQHNCQHLFFEKLNTYLNNTNHKLYYSDKDNTVNLTIQKQELRDKIKSWYCELADIPLNRKFNKMI